ncbi:phage minor head protein [Psychrobacter sp. HD31]|uniref:phage head morphogenesis protein n=1 Tax=Psychrobacter sp. HD31 TaxID=3112003 RepID=UPI003DA408BB
MTEDVKVIPHEAIAYIAGKKLKTSYNWSEIYAQEHSSAFTVAKIMELDVLDGIHKSIIKAVEDGQSFNSFKKSILERLGKSGWGDYEQVDEKTGEKITRLSNSRLKKVYQTNKTQSFHAGSWQRFQKNKATHPYLRYRLGPSKEHRLEHTKFNNLVLPVDAPFWLTHMPANGWGCNCWLQNLTKEQAQAIGISKSPEIEYHDWINKKTGRKHKVPKGIDPGFEYNVGMHREHNALKMVTDKLMGVVTQNPSAANKAMTGLLNNTAQKAMIAKVLHDMVADVAEHKRAYGNTYAVGVINDEVIDKLTKMDKAPHHSIIAVSDTQILHAIRDNKKGGLPLNFLQQLPAKLQKPDAILLEPSTAGSKKSALDNLIFVYNTPSGKVLVRLDYETKIKVNGKKERVKLNIVTTGGIITNLTSLGKYEVLYGSIN